MQNMPMHPAFLQCARVFLIGALLVGNFAFWAWVWKKGPAAYARTHVPMGK
jgi:hypothetical protein